MFVEYTITVHYLLKMLNTPESADIENLVVDQVSI